MERVRTIQLSKSVFEDNDRQAGLLREYLRSRGILLVNVMSSPGAGKTTALIALGVTRENLIDRIGGNQDA